MKTKLIIWMFSVSTLSLTACNQRFSFNEVKESCTPPPSSARFGSNPGPIITEPTEFQPFNNTVNVRGTCEPGYPVTIAGKDNINSQTVQCVNGEFSASVSFSNGDGTKELDVFQATGADGFTVTDRRCFTKDTVPPVVSIIGNTGAQSTNQTTVRLEGICESGLDVMISGPHLTNSVTTRCENGRFSTNVSFTGPDGLKNVVARQEDRAGNSGQDAKDYMIDLTPPVVVINSPSANTLTRGELTLGGQCESGVRVFISGSGLSVPALSTDCVNGQFSVPITLSSGDGIKAIIASQTDAAGNTGSDTRNFVKDNTAPNVRITMPAANTSHSGSLALSGTCETGLNVLLSGSLASNQTVACVNGQFSAQLSLMAPDGIKTIEASQTDDAGNTGRDSRNFYRDTVAPIVTIAQPAAPVVGSRNVTIAGNCETGLPVTIDGTGLSTSVNANCSNGAYSISAQLTNGDGVKQIRASQTDVAGNTGSATRSVTLDTSGPTVAITQPAANSYVTNSATIQGTCETGLTVNLTGAGLLTNVSTNCVNGAFSQLVTFSNGDGNKVVIATQTDGVGNQGSDSRTFIKDTTAPVVTITAPNADSIHRDSLTLTGACETGLSVSIGGAGAVATSTSCNNGAYSALVTLSNGDGVKNIIASQTDAAGNTGSANRNFIRDADAPVIAITSPAAGTSWMNSVQLEGVCETGLAIAVSGNGVQSPSSAVCNNGTFSFAAIFTPVDGTKTVIVSQTDAAGNVGMDSRNFIRDATAPVVRINSPAEGLINTSNLSLSGTCENGLPVSLSGAGLASATSVNCTNGTFSANVLLSNGDGNKVIVARQTDAAGNIGEDTKTYLRDSTAPVVSITQPAAGTVAQTGLHLVGTCESGLTVNISGAGLAAPLTTACVANGFSADIVFSDGDGTKVITASQTDAAGNTGSATRNFVRDNTAPLVTITQPAANSYVSASTTITGACESGPNVVLSGDITASVNIACSNGTYSGTVTFTAGDGTKSVTATQTDLAGNIGTVTRSFLRDSSTPVVAFTSPDAGTVAQNGLTVTGTCESGLNVTLAGAGVSSSSTTPCTNGTFTSAIVFSAGDGNKVVTASQTDLAGNTGSATRTFVRDATAPLVTFTSPAANTAAPTGVVVNGTCETGLNVTLSGSGLSTPLNVACVNGTFSSPITFSAGEGVKNIIASQTDAAGNTGTANRNFIRDSIAPIVRIVSPAAGLYGVSSLTISGTCETGLAVTLNGAGVQNAVQTNCINGSFSASITFTAGDGDKVVTAAQMDSAGNLGTDSRTYTRDTSAPVVRITQPAANTVARTGLQIEGTCETGLNVTLSGSGVSSSTSTTCANGVFSADITFSSGDGAKSITASQVDAAGNVGTDSRLFIKDTTAPNITITSPNAGTVARTGVTITGACETGLTVNISGSGVAAPSTTTCTANMYTAAITFSDGDGTKSITVSQTDSVGNTGSASRDFIRDTIAPVVAITLPNANTNVGNNITLAGTCETGLAVMLSGDITATSTNCVNGSFSTNIEFSIGLGVKNVVASQTDAAGNVGTDTRAFNRANNAGYYTFTSRGPGGLVDILFVDDNSASMEEEQRRLGDRFANLATELSGVDWQIGITTTDCSNGPYGICGRLLPFAGTSDYILTADTPNFVSVFQNTIRRAETFNPVTNESCLLTNSCPSGTEEGLKASMYAMNKRNTDNAGFFRDGADLAIVYLSDEDERGTGGPTATTAQQVINTFRSIWPGDKKLAAYSIIVRPGDVECFNLQRAQFGNNANYGTFYQEMVDLTGGGSFSICDNDYTLTLRQIGQDVTRLSRSIELPHVPIPSSINITYTPAYSTTYTVQGNRITFDNPAPLGTVVEITYEY